MIFAATCFEICVYLCAFFFSIRGYELGVRFGIFGAVIGIILGGIFGFFFPFILGLLLVGFYEFRKWLGATVWKGTVHDTTKIPWVGDIVAMLVLHPVLIIG